MELEDIVGWHYDSKGKFSVKSAYMAQFASMPGGAGTSQGDDPFWRKLWGIQCQLKIKNFLWRMCHNTLAVTVRAILKRRGMKLDTRCCMCGWLDEDGAHLMLRCKEVKELWRELNLEDVRLDLIEECSPIQIMIKILKLPEEQQMTVVTLLWLWWNERNKWCMLWRPALIA